MRSVGSPSERILVVDDNIDSAELLQEVFEAAGHRVAVAHDGPAALTLGVSYQPTVAVLDIGLPKMDGFELARRLRADLPAPPLRIVAVSGYSRPGDEDRFRAAGFDVHLSKPIDLPLLLSAIRSGAT
jgi:CheY-like chemotaxis protein